MKYFFLLLFSFLLSSGVYAQNLLETIQWYTNDGKVDAFEVKVYHQDEQLYYSAHSSVIESKSPYLPNLSTYYPEESYTIKSSENGIAEIFKNEKAVGKIVNKTLSDNQIETIQYEKIGDSITACYVTLNNGNDGIIKTWFDPRSKEELFRIRYGSVFNGCDFYYSFDKERRIIKEIIFRNNVVIRVLNKIYFD